MNQLELAGSHIGAITRIIPGPPAVTVTHGFQAHPGGAIYIRSTHAPQHNAFFGEILRNLQCNHGET